MITQYFAWVVVLTEISANLLISGLVKSQYLVTPIADTGQIYTKGENCDFPYVVALRLEIANTNHSPDDAKRDIIEVLRKEGLGFLACIVSKPVKSTWCCGGYLAKKMDQGVPTRADRINAEEGQPS